MTRFTGFKHTTFRASLVSNDIRPVYKGRAICYEDGRRLWQETSRVFRMSRGDALRDAQEISRSYIINQFDKQSAA